MNATKFRKPPAILILGLVSIAIVVWLWHASESGKGGQVASTTVPTVAVAKVDREDLFQEVTIPAEFRPYEEVELHAKVSGYVKDMNVDIGDRVKAGQLLATLEIPELQGELSQALAEEKHADADYSDNHLAYTRLTAVNQQHPNLVAQQDLDVAQSKDLAAAAAVAAAKADAQKYQAMVDYSHITAPFDGVITRRYADPGALIQAGTGSDPMVKSLLHISDNYRLRLDFPVSVAYVRDIHLGDQVEVRVESLGGQSRDGVISRFTDRVDEDTRTMMTEIDVTNANLELVPGMYATVVLKAGHRPQALAVPIQAVAGGKNPVVYVVNQAQQLEERTVTLGLETPDKYEILAGLNEGDLVVIGSHAEFQPGQKVEPQLLTAQAQP